jgi:hypothetical protein
VAILFAALTFLQKQEPLLERRLDHESKILTISRAGFAPLHVQVYASTFVVNFVRDDRGHTSINSSAPISAVYTNGRLLERTLWFPWSQMREDLKNVGRLDFDEWMAETPTQFDVYCLAIDARNMLSNQSVIELVLTPRLRFRASIFGPIPQSGALGGGYPKDLFAVEALIKNDCRTLYDKVR